MLKELAFAVNSDSIHTLLIDQFILTGHKDLEDN